MLQEASQRHSLIMFDMSASPRKMVHSQVMEQNEDPEVQDYLQLQEMEKVAEKLVQQYEGAYLNDFPHCITSL